MAHWGQITSLCKNTSLRIMFTAKPAHFQTCSLPNLFTSKPVHFQSHSLPNLITSKSCHFENKSLPWPPVTKKHTWGLRVHTIRSDLTWMELWLYATSLPAHHRLLLRFSAVLIHVIFLHWAACSGLLVSSAFPSASTNGSDLIAVWVYTLCDKLCIQSLSFKTGDEEVLV